MDADRNAIGDRDARIPEPVVSLRLTVLAPGNVSRVDLPQRQAVPTCAGVVASL